MQGLSSMQQERLSPEALATVLQAVQAQARRHRALARACPQLLGDLAALLCGLRLVVMLDYAPGTTPAQLCSMLSAVQQPAAAGSTLPLCVLELEGCCYIAARTQLLHVLEQLSSSSLQPGSAVWPLVVTCCGDGVPAPAPPRLVGPQDAALARELQDGVAALAARVAAAPPNGSSVPAISLNADADASCGPLPAMPTLNGLLLRYPLIYWVRDQASAAAASTALSGCTLRLHRISAACPALARVGQTPDSRVVLQAFTAPTTLDAALVEQRVAATVEALRAACRPGGAAAACWQDVQLDVSVVEPGDSRVVL